MNREVATFGAGEGRCAMLLGVSVDALSKGLNCETAWKQARWRGSQRFMRAGERAALWCQSVDGAWVQSGSPTRVSHSAAKYRL